MKSQTVQPGEFIKPSGASLRNVPDENEVVKVWEEVGACFGYLKPDGWRLQVHKMGEEVKLFSRNGVDWAAKYPTIAQMIRDQVKYDQVVLDTELVGFDQQGNHLEPAKLRQASQYRCYLLDALYLNGRDLTSLSTQERLFFIREYLQTAFGGIFALAEYTFIGSQEDMIRLYRQYQLRSKEGFDGTIVKRLNALYFTDALKVKPEETVDAVVAGAYKNDQGAIRSLLLVVPWRERMCLIPFAKITFKEAEWESLWKGCQFDIVEQRSKALKEFADGPDLWIHPTLVAEVKIKHLYPDENCIVRGDYVIKCVLREDKGPEDATSLEQILQNHGLQIADLAEKMQVLKERSKLQQPGLFDEGISATTENTPKKWSLDVEATSLEEVSTNEQLLQNNVSNKGFVQLKLFG
jgi:DNA ligase 1